MNKQAHTVTAVGIIIFMSLLLLRPANPALADTVSLNPSADSYTSQQFSGSNFGGNIVFDARYYPGESKTDNIYIEFDLASIPMPSTINNATLRLYVSQAGGADNRSLVVQCVEEDWEENTITWNNQPGLIFEGPATYNPVPLTPFVYHEWDITEIVRAWTNGTLANRGICITHADGETESFYRIFQSREGANKPILAIDFTPSASAGSQGETGDNPDVQEQDKNPPIISNIKVIRIRPNQATITWTTSEQTDTFVDYGLKKEYASSTGKYDRTTKHSIRLTGLKANSKYHFIVKSKDRAGNATSSQDLTFKTRTLSTVKKTDSQIDWTKVLLIILSVLTILLIISVAILGTLLYRKKQPLPKSNRDS